MTKRRLKVMWDYGAFPVWADDYFPEGSPQDGWQVSTGKLSISPELREDLQAWSDEWTDVMWGERGPDDPQWKPAPRATFKRWDARGRKLADRLQKELGSDYEVVYFDESELFPEFNE